MTDVTKVIAIIQARMGSTRLPSKVMKKICGKPIIAHIIERALQAKSLDQIVVATSTNDSDTPLYDYLSSNNITCIRGSELDVLSRYYEAATKINADVIVRLTGDNPLVDYNMIDSTVDYFNTSNMQYVSTIDVPEIVKPIPLGVGCEVFSYDLLQEAYQNADKPYEREHVTPYMYRDKVNLEKNISDDYSFRLTVDTDEDFMCISIIYDLLYHGKHDFCTPEIIRCLIDNPEIPMINSNITQKKLGE